MSEDPTDDPQVIQFKPIVGGLKAPDGPSRDELANMIRKVLSTSELFKMNAPKSRKRKGTVEVIEFDCFSANKKKDNG